MPQDTAESGTTGAVVGKSNGASHAGVWRVQLLGGLRITRNEASPSEEAEITHFRTHKTALLLARLLLYPHRSHSRDELADWLWPDIEADRGRANLSQTLLRLRKQFGDASLFAADHQHIRVRVHAFETDVARFEQLVRQARGSANASASATWGAALQTYGGDLLPGFYDDWIERERVRLQEMWEEVQTYHANTKRLVPPSPPHSVAPVVTDAPETEPTPTTFGFPLTLTRFFGRDTEISRITHLLTQTPPVRLMTLIGMGGIGKTRLALEVAGLLADSTDKPFGSFVFAPLADVSGAEHVPGAIARILNPETTETNEVFGLVVRSLRDLIGGRNTRLLLVLDNTEQFGGGLAPLVTRLLVQLPFVTLLVTSRQPVGVAGEQEVFVGPISQETNCLESDSPAVQVFVDRARLVRPDFAVTPANEKAIQDLCALLEGVPLALELAAAWARALSPAQIAARLNHRFDLLALRGVAGGEVPKRHHSLHAAISWSYDLLPPSLQTFWAKLSVFRGGWTAEAAQTVLEIKDASEPLLLLTERSLIIAEPDEATGEVRFRMLESLREFAEAQWEIQSEGAGVNAASSLRERHARYFEGLAQNTRAVLDAGGGLQPALRQIGKDRENVRAALLYTLTRDNETNDTEEKARMAADLRAVGVRLALQTTWLWNGGEYPTYLRLADTVAISLPEDLGRPLHAMLYAELGFHLLYTGDLAAAAEHLEESLRVWQELGKTEQVIAVKSRLGSLAHRTGHHQDAIALWTECLTFIQQHPQYNKVPRHQAILLNNLATTGPDLAQRRIWAEQAVLLDRKHSPGSHFLACSLNTLGDVAFQQGEWENARRIFEEAHAVAVADGAPGMVGLTQINLAAVCEKTGENLDQAERLLQEAETLFQHYQEPPRVAEARLVRFSVALRRGDLQAARAAARDYLQVNDEANLMNADARAAARADLICQMEKAGFKPTNGVPYSQDFF